ncbi:MAG: EFR1 family ferrodoxin [Christensenellaceae bacterium]|nr:EFR1 family ferrodoxin [Christensenellaceae bacterium]
MIYYFSGTGNSRAVAQQLSELLHEEMSDMSGKNWNDQSHAAIIGFVFPVHAWGLPREVERFIRTMEDVPLSYCFAVLTCGDDCGLAAEGLSSLLRQQHVRLHYAASVVMPNTYVSFPFFDTDNSDLTARKLQEAPRRLLSIAESISARRSGFSSVHRGSFPWLKSRLLRPIFRRLLATPRHFSVTAGCIRCGRCAAICPLGNISQSGSRPVHSKHCTDCLACYHVCPRHAIAFTCFTRGKGQYLHPQIAASFRK